MNFETEITTLLKKLEESLLNAQVRHSVEKLSMLIADEFIEIGASGKIYNKSQTIEALLNTPLKQITLANFNTIKLTENIVLVTYRAAEQNKIQIKTKRSCRSSIWKKADKNWKIIFHQGTPLQNEAE